MPQVGSTQRAGASCGASGGHTVVNAPLACQLTLFLLVDPTLALSPGWLSTGKKQHVCQAAAEAERG